MARKPSFQYKKTRSGWKVEIPERLSPNGRRQRAFFSTRDEAKDYAAELRVDYEEHGTKASIIAPSLPASSTKTGRRSFIHMPTPLAAWLKAYPVQDPVLPLNWHKKEKAVRRLAGWRVWSDFVEPHDPPADLPEWPQNALRHTHASVHVALGKPLESLTFEFGHSGGAQVLKSHYVGVIPKSEANKIMKLRP